MTCSMLIAHERRTSMRRFCIGLICLLTSAATQCLGIAAEAPDFNTAVLPVFRKYCNGCHNSRDAEAGLILEDFARTLKGGDEGAILIGGKSAESRLWKVISGQADPQMPPEDQPQPKPEELAVIKAWIDAGAKPPAGGLSAVGLVTPHIAPTAKVREPVTALSADPKGRWLAIARPNVVEIVTLADQQPVQQLTGHTGPIDDVRFSADGEQLIVAAGEPGLSGEATLWQTGDWTRRLVLVGHRDALYAAAVSPDGKTIATSSYDRDSRTWNAETGEPLATITGHNDAVYALGFHPNSQLLATASGDRTVKLWDVATGQRLDTFSQPAKEQYSVSLSPDGKYVAAGGVDCRVRVWELSPTAKEGTNPILYARFAHEAPILKVLFSPDGRLLVSCSEERRIKVWETKTFTQVALLERQTDWPAAVAFSPDSRRLFVGRMDGSLQNYEVNPKWADSMTELKPLSESLDAQPSIDLPLAMDVAEVEPNDEPSTAMPVTLPAQLTGKFLSPGGDADADLYRFHAQAGETWVLETNAARNKSAADTKLEILHADGQPVRRALLQAVRDSWITFRPIDSSTLQVRVEYWEEMDLDQYLYMNGEIGKFHRAPRGPDSGYDFYDNRGKRRPYFDTTAITHAKDEPVYIVEAYPADTTLIDNGLPVFPLNYVNDDDSEREIGSDSRLTFTAPMDGDYLVRVSDARGFTGDNYTYQLTIRPPKPDFNVVIDTKNLKVPAGGGQRLKFYVDRIDNFNAPIRIDIENLPPGYHVASPTVIEASQLEAFSVLTAAVDAEPASKEAWDAVTITATGLLGRSVHHDVAVGTTTATMIVDAETEPKSLGNFGEVNLEKPGTVRVTLLPDSLTTTAADGGLVLTPGTTITAMIRVERNGYDGDIKFDIDNLPHGVIVDNIGLSGVLVRKGETERQIFLTARPWVPESTRWINAVGQGQGNPASSAIPLHIRGTPQVAGTTK